MKKFSLVIVFLFLPFSFCFSQYIDPSYFIEPEQTWATEGGINLTASNVWLNNWVGGGQSSISLGSLFTYNINYKKGLNTWRNNFEAAYGLMRQGEAAAFRKTDDYMTLRSQFSRRVTRNFKISSILEFRSQFTKGYNFVENQRRELISDILAPGIMQVSLGLSYSRQDFYSVTLSPFAGKFTFVLHDSLSAVGAYGVNPGQRVRLEGGASFRGTFQKDIFENVRLRSNLNLFANYARIQNVDINLEAFLIFRVNRYITSNISTQLIYDDDIRIVDEQGIEAPRVQLKNVLNIGFAYEF